MIFSIVSSIFAACGHICCFWCVYKSMNCLRESQCPTCRHQYYHFPTVCQTLHFLLLKIYPVAYNRRINQTLGMSRSLTVCISIFKYRHMISLVSNVTSLSSHHSCKFVFIKQVIISSIY
jgi:hypothetical protein